MSHDVATIGAELRGHERWGLLAGYDWALGTAIDLLTGMRDRPDAEVTLDFPAPVTVRYADILAVEFRPGMPGRGVA